MRKLAICVALALSFVFIFTAEQAIAAPKIDGKPTLNWGKDINRSACPPGKLVVNVTFGVTNDADSGMAGNYWAIDNYNKHIQVWETSTGSFCASVRYMGSFLTVEGFSPGGAGLVPAGIKGTFEGGYKATFTGAVKAGVRNKGNIGTKEYGWDGIDQTLSGMTFFDWTAEFFTGVAAFDQPWWGWIYHGGNDGVWVNASDGTEGDITN